MNSQQTANGFGGVPPMTPPQKSLDVSDIQAKEGEYNPNFGKRPDGTTKGKGFLGVLKRPDGNISTELTVGVNIGGKDVDIPTIVPTLSRKELDQLLNLKDDARIPEPIIQKAVDHAKMRMRQGKSVYAD